MSSLPPDVPGPYVPPEDPHDERDDGGPGWAAVSSWPPVEPPAERPIRWRPADPSAEPPPPTWSGAAPPPPPPADLPTPQHRTSRSRARRAAIAVPVLTVLASGAAGFVGGRLSSRSSAAPTAVTAVPVSTGGTSSSFNIQAVLTRLQSSVVSVDTAIQTRRGPFVVQGQGAGTGMVLDNAGHILTNAHVIDGATSITVTLSGQTKARPATLVASDTNADVAVLHVNDTSGMVPVVAAAQGVGQVGDEVIAIGNALALEGGLSVTEGIVSALNRTIQTDTGSLAGLLQTDAAISSGNSGGPLVDSAGEVVGMNTAVAASGQGVQASNIGFAIPIHTAVDVAHRLIGQST